MPESESYHRPPDAKPKVDTEPFEYLPSEPPKKKSHKKGGGIKVVSSSSAPFESESSASASASASADPAHRPPNPNSSYYADLPESESYQLPPDAKPKVDTELFAYVPSDPPKKKSHKKGGGRKADTDPVVSASQVYPPSGPPKKKSHKKGGGLAPPGKPVTPLGGGGPTSSAGKQLQAAWMASSQQQQRRRVELPTPSDLHRRRGSDVFAAIAAYNAELAKVGLADENAPALIRKMRQQDANWSSYEGSMIEAAMKIEHLSRDIVALAYATLVRGTA